MPYPELMIRPYRQELTSIGFEELTTAEDVDRWIAARDASGDDTALLVVNSVCGCAAGMARPGVRLALEHGNRPKRLATKARSYFPDIPPSSPSMALWKDGELVYFVPRHRIEGRDMEAVAEDLKSAFDEHCSAAGG